MLIFIIALLAFFVFWDARLLHRRDETVYRQIMHYSEFAWTLWHVVLGIAVLPVYLLRRNRFKKQVTVPADAVPRAQLIAADACAVFLYWMMGMTVWTVITEIFKIFFPSFDGTIEELILSAAFSSLWMVYLIYRTTQRYRGEGFFKFVGLRRNGAPFWQLVVVPALAGICFSLIASIIIWERPVQPPTPLSRVIESTTSVPWMMVFVGMAVIVAPLLEEITFRGYFYRVLLFIKGKWFTVCFISFLFALLHVNQYWGDWPAIALVAILGFILTTLRLWTGTAIASAVAHYVYNAGVTFIPMIMLLLANPAYLEYRLTYHNLDFAAKEALLEESIVADPNLAEAYNDLAWVYAEQDKNLDEALALIEKALNFEPLNNAFLDTKAEVLYKLGRIDEAIEIEEGIAADTPFLREHVEKQLQKFYKAKKQLGN